MDPSAKLGDENITDSSNVDFAGASSISLQPEFILTTAANVIIVIIRFILIVPFGLEINI